MIIWLVVELAIMLEWSVLHGIYFASGLVPTVLAVLALSAWPVTFRGRVPGGSRTSSDRSGRGASGRMAS